jgi:hypothetical protein
LDWIRRSDLERLRDGGVSILRIRNFTSAHVAQYIAGKLYGHWSRSAYRNTPELIRVGESHYETHNADGRTDDEALENYLTSADRLMAEIRNACQPYLSPLDQLWRMLDREVGVQLATINGRKMFAGIVRIFPEGSQLLPHNDIFERDAPGLEVAQRIEAQFAANVYLEAPEIGGHLQIWEWRPSADELNKLQALDSKYGVDRSKLPPPDLEVECVPGDLILMDATKLHAVSRQEKGRRMGISCFLGYQSGKPLICWS